MHRWFASVVFLLGSVLSATPLSATALDLFIGSATVNVGTTFVIPVELANVSDLYAYQFDLTYHGGIIELLSVAEGPFLATAGSTFFIPGVIDNPAGRLFSSANTLLGGIPGASGSGEIALLTFRALAQGRSWLGFPEVIWLDSNGDFISSTIGFGQVDVVIPEPGTAVLISAPLAWLAWRRRHQVPWRSPRTSRA
jgi:hypothetical protein